VQLDGLIALFERALAGLADFDGGGVAEQACIGWQRPDGGTADELPDRQVRGLAGDVPERDVQGGQRVHVRAVAAEQVHALSKTRREAANVARVLAKRPRCNLRIDNGAGCCAAGVTETFAPALEALVGDDAHEQRVERRPADAHESGRRGADVAWDADVVGLDCDNLHRELMARDW
jgi:hypothetical protein